MRRISSFKALCQRVSQTAVLPPYRATRLILVGGCSCTGKSTLVTKLSENLQSDKIESRVVSLDSWLIGVDQRKPVSTVLERYECPEIVDSVRRILKGEMVYPPVYDPVSRRRIAQKGKQSIHAPSGIVFVEGVVALAMSELSDMASLKIYLSTPDAIRMERLSLLYNKIKGLSCEETDDIIQAREKEEVPFIKNTQDSADVIFINEHVADLER